LRDNATDNFLHRQPFSPSEITAVWLLSQSDAKIIFGILKIPDQPEQIIVIGKHPRAHLIIRRRHEIICDQHIGLINAGVRAATG